MKTLILLLWLGHSNDEVYLQDKKSFANIEDCKKLAELENAKEEIVSKTRFRGISFKYVCVEAKVIENDH